MLQFREVDMWWCSSTEPKATEDLNVPLSSWITWMIVDTVLVELKLLCNFAYCRLWLWRFFGGYLTENSLPALNSCHLCQWAILICTRIEPLHSPVFKFSLKEIIRRKNVELEMNMREQFVWNKSPQCQTQWYHPSNGQGRELCKC